MGMNQRSKLMDGEMERLMLLNEAYGSEAAAMKRMLEHM